jgi:type IV pilus assembly protein PilW
MADGNSDLLVANPYATRPGDLLLLLWPATLNDCSLVEVTGRPASNRFEHKPGAPYQLLGTLTNETARFNRPGGLTVAYGGVGSTTGNVTRVYNLGNLYEPANRANIPVNNTYAIDASNALTVTAAFVSKDAQSAPLTSPVADNIVHMRALYGVDDGVGDLASVPFGAGKFVAGDGLVDRFVDAATFNALPTPPWQSLIAVRVAIVARSALAEKATGAGGTCETTMAFPAWSGGTFDLSADPNWRCYRYRVFETTVPLRNWIWKSS